MLPRDLLETAKYLANSSKGKPKQADLRRAVSSAYYALFHTLAKTCADMLIGLSGERRSKQAWAQTYRALEHGFAKQCCSNNVKMATFPPNIQNFANQFAQMQVKRHTADYDPNCKLFKSAVLTDIALAEVTIDAFVRVPAMHRRAFAAFVILKDRKS